MLCHLLRNFQEMGLENDLWYIKQKQCRSEKIFLPGTLKSIHTLVFSVFLINQRR